MTIYFKKTWGWRPPVGPLVFSREGARDNALQDLLKPGDLVVIVGTKGKNTPEEQRGRLLGIVEPTNKAVGWLDFELPRRDVDFDKDNQFKWPFGIHINRAWELPSRPEMSEISERQFLREGALQLEPFNPTETARILKLDRQIVDTLPPTAAAKATLSPDRKPGRHSPVPAGMPTWIVSRRHQPAFTYAFSIDGPTGRAFKIGWAFDWKKRLKQFKHASLPDLGGVRYGGFLFHLWDTAMAAYLMEQRALEAFAGNRHPANHEVVVGITEKELRATWAKLIAQRDH